MARRLALAHALKMVAEFVHKTAAVRSYSGLGQHIYPGYPVIPVLEPNPRGHGRFPQQKTVQNFLDGLVHSGGRSVAQFLGMGRGNVGLQVVGDHGPVRGFQWFEKQVQPLLRHLAGNEQRVGFVVLADEFPFGIGLRQPEIEIRPFLESVVLEDRGQILPDVLVQKYAAVLGLVHDHGARLQYGPVGLVGCVAPHMLERDEHAEEHGRGLFPVNGERRLLTQQLMGGHVLNV